MVAGTAQNPLLSGNLVQVCLALHVSVCCRCCVSLGKQIAINEQPIRRKQLGKREMTNLRRLCVLVKFSSVLKY